MQVYKQKVKHLLYEHQQSIVALRVEAEEQLRQAADEASKRIRELMVDKQDLQRDYNEQVSNAAPHKAQYRLAMCSAQTQMRSHWLPPAATSVSELLSASQGEMPGRCACARLKGSSFC